MRLVLDLGKVKPYLEGLAGLRSYYTRTKVTHEEWNDEKESYERSTLSSYTSIFDMALSYGTGGGLLIGAEDLFFNIGLSYFGGTNVDVFGPDHLNSMTYSFNHSGSVFAKSLLDPVKAVSKMVIFSIGISKVL